MCNKTKIVRVKIPADLSHTGKEYWKDANIDACIADIVESLQNVGIDMRGSCCGHGKEDGSIFLQDGRTIKITNNDKEYGMGIKWESDLIRDIFYTHR